MKRLIHFSIIVGIIGLVVACDKADDPEGASESKTFVQTYFIASAVQMTGLSEEGMYFTLEFDGELVSEHEPRNPDKFWSLAAKYGDMSYNQRLPTPYTNNALANEIASISVISDADYDASHPAGTSLNDIVCLSGESYYPFVKSGYNEDSWNTFDKPLAQLTDGDKKQVSVYSGENLYEDRTEGFALLGEFYFSSAPTSSPVHNITLTIIDTDGNTFSTTKSLDFSL